MAPKTSYESDNDPRRQVGAIIRSGEGDTAERFIVVKPGYGFEGTQRHLRTRVWATPIDSDVFDGWATPAQCKRFGIPYVHRRPAGDSQRPAVLLDRRAWDISDRLDDGTPRRIGASLQILDVPMHVTGIRVTHDDPDNPNNFHATHPDDEDEVANVYRLYEGETYETATLDGFRYLIYVVPYQH